MMHLQNDSGVLQADLNQGDVPTMAYYRFHDRLAQFREISDHHTYWETRWSQHQIREILSAHSKGKLDEFEDVFLRYLPRDRPILEAGCGLGQLVAALKGRGYRVEGVDYAQDTVAAIREAAPELSVRVGDVYHLDSPEGNYGGYISIGIFEHNPIGPVDGLREVRRVLNDDGVALIAVPYLNRARRRLLTSAPQAEKERLSNRLGFYQYYYSVEEFESYIKDAGLEVVERFPYSVYAGLTRDYPLGQWLFRHAFFSWNFHKRFTKWCRQAPMQARWRWAHMVMFVCRRAH